MTNNSSDYIRNALSLFHEDDQGIYISGSFMSFLSDIHLARARGQEVPPVVRPLLFVHQDIWNIATLAQRLDWQHSLNQKGILSDQDWMSFAALDIDHFHVEFRSIFDYLGQLLQKLADKPGQVTQGSFQELRNWLQKSLVNRRKLGEGLANIVILCDWFSELREIRDATVHRGGFTVVFPDRKKILFQVPQTKLLN